MVLETVVELGWDIPQLNVQTAFINDNAEEEVCVKMAPGYEKKDEQTCVQLVMRLRKILYRLRQSHKNWHGSTSDTYVMKSEINPLQF